MQAVVRVQTGDKVREEVVELKGSKPSEWIASAKEHYAPKNAKLPADRKHVVLSVRKF